MSGGWIKLHRGLLESESVSDDWLCRLWVVVLLKANSRPGIFKGIKIEPGSFAFSYRVLSEFLGVSRGKLKRGLKKLENSGQISLKAGRAFSTVSICNWSVYQAHKEEGRDANGSTDGSTSGATDGTTNGSRTRKEEPKNQRTKEDKGKTSSSEIPNPEKLNDLINAWNQLPDVRKCQKRDSDDILNGWRKVQKKPDWRSCFEDIAAITKSISEADWLRSQGFFELAWLFGVKDSKRNIEKLLNGNYKKESNANRIQATRPGRYHAPETDGDLARIYNR